MRSMKVSSRVVLTTPQEKHCQDDGGVPPKADTPALARSMSGRMGALRDRLSPGTTHRDLWGIAKAKMTGRRNLRELAKAKNITRRDTDTGVYGVDAELHDLQIDLHVQEYITLASATSDLDSKVVCPTQTVKQGRKRASVQVREIIASAAVLKNQLLGWENGGGAESGMLQRHQHWSKLRDKGVVDSSDPAVVRWRLLFLAAVLSVCCTADPIDATYNVPAPKSSVLVSRVFGVVLDALFAIDTALALRVTKMGLDGTILTDPRKVIRQNARTPWFAVACVTAIPYSSIIWAARSAGAGASGTAVLALKCLRLTRMLRAFVTHQDASTGLLKKGGGAATGFQMVLVAARFAVVCNCSACLFYLVSHQYEGAEDGSAGGELTNWVEANGIEGPSQHMQVFYMAFLMLMGENTGQLFTDAERTATVVIMFLGAILFAMLFGKVALLINNFNRDVSRFEARLETVNEHTTHLGLPQHICARIKLFYEYRWMMNRCLDYQHWVAELPESLQSQVTYYIYGSMVRRVPVFRNMPCGMLLAVVRALQPMVFLAGDLVVREGEVGVQMFFLRKGRMQVGLRGQVDGKAHVGTISRGDFFGETALLDPQQAGDLGNAGAGAAQGHVEGKRRPGTQTLAGVRRTATVVAVTFCEASVFTAAHFAQVPTNPWFY
jgi:hypothetical protein